MQSKLIIVPGMGVDLFSLKTKYGIARGPIKTPTPFPISVIRDLVTQFNKPEIYEVVVENADRYPDHSVVYSRPVLLTADNYDLPYHEIAGEPAPVPVKVKIVNITDSAELAELMTPAIEEVVEDQEILDEEEPQVEVEEDNEPTEESQVEVEEVLGAVDETEIVEPAKEVHISKKTKKR